MTNTDDTGVFKNTIWLIFPTGLKRPVTPGKGAVRSDPALPWCRNPAKCRSGISPDHPSWRSTPAKSWWGGVRSRWPEPAGRYWSSRQPTRRPTTCHGRMLPGLCSNRLQVDLFASGKGLPNTGLWSADRTICRRWHGATRTRWLGQSRLQTVSRFTPSHFNAQSGVRRRGHSQGASMVGGSRQSWWGHSRVSLVVRAGKRRARWCGSG